MMNFCIGATDDYVGYAIVMMTSLCANNSNESKKFYIVSDEIKPKTMEMLDIASKKLKIETEVHILDTDRFDWLKMNHKKTKVTLYPLVLNEILPADADRCMCLEVDTMVSGDISEYYHINMGDNVMAGSPIGLGITETVDPKALVISPEQIEEKRINTGVVLFNMDKIREENFDLDFYRKSYLKNQSGAITTGETVLNVAHAGRILYINPALYHYRSYFHNAYVNRGFNVEDKRITHFTDRRPILQKPWIILLDEKFEMYFDSSETPGKKTQSLIHDLYSEWWGYAKQSINYLELEASMNARKDFYKKYMWPIISKK